MTPQELRIKRMKAIESFTRRALRGGVGAVGAVGDVLDVLEELDAAYIVAQSPQDAFYAFIRTHDLEYHALMQSQGTSSQRIMIDTMISTLMKYAETLDKEGQE